MGTTSALAHFRKAELNLTQRRKGAKVKTIECRLMNKDMRGGNSSVAEWLTYPGRSLFPNQWARWWFVLSPLGQPTNHRLENLKRSVLHGFNLCAFASLREIFCGLVAATSLIWRATKS
jgi:hypothetical protein